MQFNITKIQLFDYVDVQNLDYQYWYSANLIINDSFVVQISGDLNQATFDGITDSSLCYWKSEELQDQAYENISKSDLLEALEDAGFENNIHWLEEHADEVINPENAKYRC